MNTIIPHVQAHPAFQRLIKGNVLMNTHIYYVYVLSAVGFEDYVRRQKCGLYMGDYST